MKHSPIIVGVDEAGRGALAGPVVAGACIEIPKLKKNPLIDDSKQMTPESREEAYEWITKHCTIGFGISDAAFIDRHGILAATERAMQLAVAMIATITRPDFLIVDGRDKFWFDYPHTSIIDGDALEPAIGAASIVAKVTRDRLMIEADATFPGFGFAQHKAYGTAEHFAAIEKLGACEIHRKTFIHPQQNSLSPAHSPHPNLLPMGEGAACLLHHHTTAPARKSGIV